MIDIDKFFFIGQVDEVKQFQRKLDFDSDEIQDYYVKLIPEYQKCVFDILKALVSNKDIFGYNLKRFLEAYAKETEVQISQLSISRQLTFDAKKFLSEEQYDDFDYKGKTEHDVNKQLDAGKTTAILKEDTELYKYAQTICDYLLVDMELLQNGIGKIYTIKDEWFDTYMNDAKFCDLANKKIFDIWNTRLRVEFFEEYLKEKGELNSDESVLETVWCVMTYCGIFKWLKSQKGKKNEINAVKGLIKNLYALQLVKGDFPYEYIEE